MARYDGWDDPSSALDAMPSSLTATVLRGQGEMDLLLAVSRELRTRVGRLVCDAYPTGGRLAVQIAHRSGPDRDLWPCPAPRPAP
ncbi:hypothetical protein [Geodermatophilus sp. URMC 65]